MVSLTDSATQVVTATDAKFTVDGVEIERTSNTITDLFSGVTVELSDVSSADLGTDQSISSSSVSYTHLTLPTNREV